MADPDAWIPYRPQPEVTPVPAPVAPSAPAPALRDEEVVDGLPVLAELREVVPARIVAIPAVQAAAAAATGFVAGAATFALARRLGARRLARMEQSVAGGRPGLLPATGRRTFLVHVRVLGRPGESSYPARVRRPAGVPDPIELPGSIEVRREVRPRWPFRLPLRNGLDGLTRVRGRVLHRLLHAGGCEPVLVRVVQTAPDRVLFGASSDDRDAAEWGIERMRMALGVDQDLRPFHERFRFDPLIGPALRAKPGLRVSGRPEPFEALAWAICEQLIEFERATAIERRLVWKLGAVCSSCGLRDAPAAATVAGQAPALLESFGLSAGRSVALVRAAREVASGRVDLLTSDRDAHERGWRRLRAIRGIGTWTVQMLALTGQGRVDQLPAGDLGLLKLVGRLRTGDPRARATEEEVTEFFAPYEPWAGLAGVYAMGLGGALRAGRLRAVAASA